MSLPLKVQRQPVRWQWGQLHHAKWQPLLSSRKLERQRKMMRKMSQQQELNPTSLKKVPLKLTGKIFATMQKKSLTTFMEILLKNLQRQPAMQKHAPYHLKDCGLVTVPWRQKKITTTKLRCHLRWQAKECPPTQAAAKMHKEKAESGKSQPPPPARGPPRPTHPPPPQRATAVAARLCWKGATPRGCRRSTSPATAGPT